MSVVFLKVDMLFCSLSNFLRSFLYEWRQARIDFKRLDNFMVLLWRWAAYGSACLCIILISVSLSYAGSPELGIQLFAEKNDDHERIAGVNLIMTDPFLDAAPDAYFGIGFKHVDSVETRVKGDYGQLLAGVALSWQLTPFFEVGFDLKDFIGNVLLEGRGDVDYSVGLGLRFKLDHHMALDLAYKIHAFHAGDAFRVYEEDGSFWSYRDTIRLKTFAINASYVF